MDDLENKAENIEQTEEKQEEEKLKEADAKKKKRKVLRTVMIIILLAILAVVIYFAAVLLSVKNSDSPVGYWVIKEGTSGGVTMTEEDAEAIGLNEIGSVRLDESGKCEVNILGEESSGTWTSDDDGTITISYGEEKTLTATIDDEGIMTAQGENQLEYTLEK